MALLPTWQQVGSWHWLESVDSVLRLGKGSTVERAPTTRDGVILPQAESKRENKYGFCAAQPIFDSKVTRSKSS